MGLSHALPPQCGRKAAKRREPCDNRSLPAPKMLVRTLRPIDVVALASFQRRAGGTEISAHNWPRVEPESGRLPYFNLVSASIGHRPGGQRAWVAESGGRVVGIAAARARAGGLVWDVMHRHADQGEDRAAAELLEQVAAC